MRPRTGRSIPDEEGGEEEDANGSAAPDGGSSEGSVLKGD